MDKLTFSLYCIDVVGIALAGVLYLAGAAIAARFVFIVIMFGSAGLHFYAHDDVAYMRIALGVLSIPSFFNLTWAMHQWEKQIKKAQKGA